MQFFVLLLFSFIFITFCLLCWVVSTAFCGLMSIIGGFVLSTWQFYFYLHYLSLWCYIWSLIRKKYYKKHKIFSFSWNIHLLHNCHHHRCLLNVKCIQNIYVNITLKEFWKIFHIIFFWKSYITTLRQSSFSNYNSLAAFATFLLILGFLCLIWGAFHLFKTSCCCTTSTLEWVGSFLTAYQHIEGHSVPAHWINMT